MKIEDKIYKKVVKSEIEETLKGLNEDALASPNINWSSSKVTIAPQADRAEDISNMRGNIV